MNSSGAIAQRQELSIALSLNVAARSGLVPALANNLPNALH
jgi:hypothetical protein